MDGGRCGHSGDFTSTWREHNHRDCGIKKKEDSLSYVNEEYFQNHDQFKIRVEMDEMWGFYGDKRHQLWLWWAMDHDSGEVIAFWFGTREHHHWDTLLALLSPLTLVKDTWMATTLITNDFLRRLLWYRSVTLKNWSASIYRYAHGAVAWCGRAYDFPKRNKCTKVPSD